MGNLIVENWNRSGRRLPGIDCVAFPDGKVTILNIYSLYDPNTKETQWFCRPLCDTTIDSIEQYDAAYWTRVDVWTMIDCCGGKIYGGDGTMGNQGFIAHVDAADNLIWGMFFEHTNPIKRLTIQDRTLLAINEHDELQIKIHLDTLTDIRILSMKQW